MKQYTKKGNYSKTYIKFMQGMYERYLQATQTRLEQCYSKPSESKLYAMEKIRQRADTKVYILSHNTFHFVVAYFTTEEENSYFVVDTGRNVYTILDIYI